MSDIAIKVTKLSKVYKIGALRYGHETLREAVMGAITAPMIRFKKIFGSVGRRQSSVVRQPSNDTIWALNDISVEVKQGEVVGIIGNNGAGKTTLLRILSRITEPSDGRAEIHGRVGSLLEVGTGFHPELTGRENIYLNGAILGMQKREIESKFKEIVDFAEIEKFIDTPVKRYSSGMYVRLAFAVAAHMEPEMLLVDEVLAVGDADFQKKCMGKMSYEAKAGRTILFVSHNMGAVKSLCSRAILLDRGRIAASGSPSEVISFYLQETLASDVTTSGTWKSTSDRCGDSCEITLVSVALVDSSGGRRATFAVDEVCSVVIDYIVHVPITGLRIHLQLQTSQGIVAFTTYEDSSVIEGRTVLPGKYRAECTIPSNLLNIDTYLVSVAISMPKVKVIVPWTTTTRLQMLETTSHSRYYYTLPGVVRPKLEWMTRSLS